MDLRCILLSILFLVSTPSPVFDSEAWARHGTPLGQEDWPERVAQRSPTPFSPERFSVAGPELRQSTRRKQSRAHDVSLGLQAGQHGCLTH